MTKQELLDGLEGLKDMLNDGGKYQVETLKGAVRELVPDAEAVEDEPKPPRRRFSGDIQ